MRGQERSIQICRCIDRSTKFTQEHSNKKRGRHRRHPRFRCARAGTLVGRLHLRGSYSGAIFLQAGVDALWIEVGVFVWRKLVLANAFA
jgi:hypothetical protein